MESINEILRSNPRSNFTGLITKAQQLQSLNHIFCNLLDSVLATHCFVAKLIGDELTVCVESSSWATRLKYAIPDIIKKLQYQPELKNVTKIIYRISPKVEIFKQEKAVKSTISAENDKLWRETLEYLKNKD
jgi:hypothetical protein